MKTAHDALPERQYTGPQLVKKEATAVSWADYLRIAPGIYSAFCKSAKWYREPGYKRHTCLLRFDVLSEDMHHSLGIIPMWFNGGTGKQPKAGRRTNYFPAWIKANGGPPSRNDRLSPRVFVGRMAKISVSDTTRGPAPYSVGREILEWSTGGLQEVNQSTSHTVKEGMV